MRSFLWFFLQFLASEQKVECLLFLVLILSRIRRRDFGRVALEGETTPEEEHAETCLFGWSLFLVHCSVFLRSVLSIHCAEYSASQAPRLTCFVSFRAALLFTLVNCPFAEALFTFYKISSFLCDLQYSSTISSSFFHLSSLPCARERNLQKMGRRMPDLTRNISILYPFWSVCTCIYLIRRGGQG